MPKKLINQFRLAGGVFLYFLCVIPLVQAQIIPDGTLSTEVSTSNNLDFTIRGNSQSGANLFHSFREFSVPTGGSASFKNANNIQNIFIRVTGSSISNIDGIVQANGTASLFLLNPNGIIFGQNASLAIGGSFIATTANQINFADGTVFSATNLQNSPLLTVSIPIGLQFRENPGDIINRSIVTNPLTVETDFVVPGGLQVQPKKTIALIGGNVVFNGGSLTAPSGGIEVGSVGSNSYVSLRTVAESWVLGYETVQKFQNIQLFQDALIDTSGLNGEGNEANRDSGNINLYGEQIIVTNQSDLTAYNEGANRGGSITLKASKSVEFSELSNISTNNFSTGISGKITIETGYFLLRDRSRIDTSNQKAGSGGQIIVNATDFVEIDGSGQRSELSTSQLSGSGNAGDLTLTTKRLFIRNGGQIRGNTTYSSSGDAGTVSINAADFIEISGRGVTEGGSTVISGIFAQSTGTETAGNAGNLNINTGNLQVRDGGEISVGSIRGSTGQAGNLNINATSIYLSNFGTLSAETQTVEGGNITLQVQNETILRNNSKITTNATREAIGGNIIINTGVLAALENSKITANAVNATGGNVIINAQGKFLSPDSMITAASERDPTFNGIVEINTPEINPSQGLIQFSETVVNPNSLISQNPCQQGKKSGLTITGRGGLPPSVNEDSDSSAVQVDLVESVPTQTRQLETSTIHLPETYTNIEPAQGWIFNEKGEVILTAYIPNLTEQQRQNEKAATCPAR